MGTSLGLVGLPNAGKSTLFNALTAGHAATAPYPFTTIDQHLGVAPVADPRLDALAKLLAPEKVVPTSLEFVDIAGLVKGAAQGEGLGNQFLSHVLAVDALLHVVRCFADAQVPHPMGEVDPVRDVSVVETELLLKDLEILDRRLQKDQKLVKSGDKTAAAFQVRLQRWHAAVAAGQPVRRLNEAPEERPHAYGVELLSAKPVLYAANVDEAGLAAEPPTVAALRAHAASQGARVAVGCAKLEAELGELAPAEQAEMMRELGVVESALPRVVRESYALLNLVTFFTTTSKILQAWTVPQGTPAVRAAGAIHTDFERTFIRAEVVPAQLLIACGSEAAARAQGKLRVEGKEYVVQDGDVIHFRVGA